MAAVPISFAEALNVSDLLAPLLTAMAISFRPVLDPRWFLRRSLSTVEN